MKLSVIFGQRACRYGGEYAPEALDVADEFTMDENPDWLHGRVEHHKGTKEFTAVSIINVDLGKDALKKIEKLLMEPPSIPGAI